MRRREFLAAALTATQRSSFAQRSADRPNIVFLLTDDQRWDSLGCMGNRIIRTPHIDSLAEAGVTFDRQFVTTAICMVSRASILTGQYAQTHGIHDFAKPLSARQFAGSYPALLRAAGYRTGFIGKYGVGEKMPADQFDYWRGFPGQGKYFPEGEPGRHLTALMGDQALEFLGDSADGRPFCLSVSFKAPHVQDEDPRQFLPSAETAGLYSDARISPPRTASPEYIAALPAEVQRSEGRRRWAVRFSTPALYEESVRNYYRLISEVDTVVGKIREALRKSGADRNTVIIYTGDNGFYLGEHGLAGKWLMHEESIRVPLIVYDPRLSNANRGSRRDQMTLNIDLAPTMMEAAGLPSPVSMQGKSLYPLLKSSSTEWRSEWFYQHLFDNNGWIPPTEGVRTKDWKYTRYIKTSPLFEELFDLRQDPLEERNLATAEPRHPQLAYLRDRCQQWRTALEQWPGTAPWSDPAGGTGKN